MVFFKPSFIWQNKKVLKHLLNDKTCDSSCVLFFEIAGAVCDGFNCVLLVVFCVDVFLVVYLLLLCLPGRQAFLMSHTEDDNETPAGKLPHSSLSHSRSVENSRLSIPKHNNP